MTVDAASRTAAPVRPTGLAWVVRFTVRSILSLFVGLKVTLRGLFGKKHTLQYPHEKPELSDAYRSAIALVTFDDISTHDCIACDACELICPSYCITVKGERIEGTKKKRANEFLVDFSTCSLCGLCLAVCPTDTLKYSRHYDDAGYNRDWLHDLLEPYKDDPPANELVERLVARDEAKRASRKKGREDRTSKAKPAPATGAKTPATQPSEALAAPPNPPAKEGPTDA